MYLFVARQRHIQSSNIAGVAYYRVPCRRAGLGEYWRRKTKAPQWQAVRACSPGKDTTNPAIENGWQGGLRGGGSGSAGRAVPNRPSRHEECDALVCPSLPAVYRRGGAVPLCLAAHCSHYRLISGARKERIAVHFHSGAGV